MRSEDWLPAASAPLDVKVLTKIDDENGERNVQTLVARQREPGCRVMWWLPDGSMYVYYQPTHWQPIEPPAPEGSQNAK